MAANLGSWRRSIFPAWVIRIADHFINHFGSLFLGTCGVYPANHPGISARAHDGFFGWSCPFKYNTSGPGTSG